MKTITFVLAGLITASLPALAKAPAAANRARADYIAHEWGTFTSVQGSDGVQLEWNPFVVEELPKFVYNAMKQAGRERGVALPNAIFLGKDGFRARQRMETPVVYFYSDKPQKVDV